MSKTIRTVERFTDCHPGIGKRCRMCGRLIKRAPYVIAGIGGARTLPHYYHAKCYPRDSRPRRAGQ